MAASALRSGLLHSWLWVLVAVAAALAGPPALALQPIPPLTGRVNDLTHTLGADHRQALEARLATLEQEKGSQLAVLLVPTTQPESIEQFGIRVAESWKLGRKGVDDGLILLVAKEDRTLRIEVGYGLEGAIPDVVAKRVIDEVIVPRFRNGDFAGGIDAGVDSLIRLVSGEPPPEPSAMAGQGMEGPPWMDDNFPMLVVFMLAAGGLLRAFMGRLLGASAAGGIAFAWGWWLMSSLAAGGIVGAIVFVFTLAGGGRGGMFGGGGGHGGGGGYSGGGGGFGGGGASGRW